MKKIFVLIGLIFLIGTTTSVAAPFEFFATVTGNTGDSLELEITPAVTIDVLVTGLTEIKDNDGTPIPIADIPGDSTATVLIPR